MIKTAETIAAVEGRKQ
ncbi:MAG: hypothetical protein ACLUIQ_01090 [Dialister invisus]